MERNNKNSKNKYLLAEGHTACSGCGELLAARHVIDAAGQNTIILNSTGCLEVTTSQYPNSSWRVPWMHSCFENSSAVASGVAAALKYKKQVQPNAGSGNGRNKKINVIAQAGDGGTFDIGLGLISGMFERNDDVLYVCYDNEAYMNTGVQASGATGLGAATTTSPAGKVIPGNRLIKKNMPEIAMAHDLSYVAVTTCGHIADIEKKVKKALTMPGAKYIQILCGCTPGWNYDTKLTVQLGKLAQQSGLYPCFEAEDGEVTSVMKVPKKKVLVDEFMKPQKRYKHLFK
ncbi:MAG: thiamine pyrophosphate-dependent enzyme, partial [Patescibacteria group bacterium]